MLAKVVNDNAGILIQRGALRFFASKLAPTEKQIDRSHALRGNAYRDAPRHPCAGHQSGGASGTRSVRGGIPTQSVGTITFAYHTAICESARGSVP